MSVIPSLGISLADHSAARGFIEDRIYEQVDHVEYGGLYPPGRDAGFVRLRERNPRLPVGRHMVRAEFTRSLDADQEAEAIRAELEGVEASYLLTDAELWRWGGSGPEHLWARPTRLTAEAARRAGENAAALSERLGIPVLVENPALLRPEGEVDVADFLCLVAAAGGGICLDVGHFYAACHNLGVDVGAAWSRLPLRAVRVAHVAGLSEVSYLGRSLMVDNHDVVPRGACLALAKRLCREAPRLGWLTYEAELASTSVQLEGLSALRRVLEPGEGGALVGA